MKSPRALPSSDGVNIAYQVVGSGPFDLVYVPGWVSNIEVMWEEPRLASFLERLASFSRLILFERERTSDAVPTEHLPTLGAPDGRRAGRHGRRRIRACSPARAFRGREHVHPVLRVVPGAHVGPRARGVLCQAVRSETTRGRRIHWNASARSRRRSGPGDGSIRRRPSRRRSSGIRRSGAGSGGSGSRPVLERRRQCADEHRVILGDSAGDRVPGSHLWAGVSDVRVEEVALSSRIRGVVRRAQGPVTDVVREMRSAPG